MCQRIIWSQGRQRKGNRNRLLQAACVSQCTNQPVMRLKMRGIRVDGCTEVFCRLSGQTCSKLIECLLRKRVGDGGNGVGHVQH